MPQSGQLILDVGPITHEAGSENAKALITDPWGTYVHALVTSDSVDHSRRLVPKHFSAKWSIDS